MNIELPYKIIKGILTAEQAKSELWIRRVQWKSDKDDVDFSVDVMSDKQLLALVDVLNATEGYKGMANKLKAFVNVRSDTKHATPIKKLQLLETALVAYIGKLPNKWLYVTGHDGKLCPCYVNKVRYEPADQRRGTEATTIADIFYSVREETQSDSLHWSQKDLKAGLTVVELLSEEGYMAETPDLNAAYEAEMKRYVDINHLTGTQFLASGNAMPADSYRYTVTPMVRDGEPTKVVMDDDDGEGQRNARRATERAASSAFWDEKKKGREDDDDNEDGTVILPTHPYLKVFDLKAHEFVTIHVTNLTDYVYDSTLVTKLVLPQMQKDLVTILIASSNIVLEDIVKGKTGGVVVIATGPAGVGKTLTAEVCSESIQRPLYSVQCSQLGTDEEALEKKLQVVLNRASRWGAVLLIDEADVYVHERGTDIQQNAIVGVWLRLMEYYRGIMFMTSNRAVVIDDAIMSRATAWIRYEIPDKESLAKIWTVLSTQYKVALDAAAIEKLTETYLGISGRSVKNLLKLARLLSAAKKEEITVELINYCSQFLDIEGKRKGDSATRRAGSPAEDHAGADR